MARGSDSSNGFVVFVTVMTGIVGAVAAGIAIYSFVTGNNTMSTVTRVGDTVIQAAPTVANGGVIEHVTLEQYRPLVFLPKAANGAQTMYAVEPASGTLWWYKPSWVVSLTCEVDQTCNGSRLLPIEPRLGYVDTLTPSRSGKQLMAMNREGDGLVYSFDTRKFTYFNFALPCVMTTWFEDFEGQRESQYSVQAVDFSDDRLELRLNGMDCEGTAKVRNQTFAISGHSPDPLRSRHRYYDLRLVFDFAGGYIANARVDRLRFEFNDQLPGWFRWASRAPAAPVPDDHNEAARKRTDRITDALRPFAGNQFYMSRDIPSKVLDGAMSAGQLDRRKIIAVVDLSIWGDGVDGVYFTTDGVASRSSVGARVWAPYDRLNVTPTINGNSLVYGNLAIFALATYPQDQLIKAIEAARLASLEPPPMLAPTLTDPPVTAPVDPLLTTSADAPVTTPVDAPPATPPAH